MGKKVAVLAVNPVNGFGLFQYLEAFFENGISYRVFAVADTKEIKTNSGITMFTDDVVANLKGHEDEYDALVFGCGDAVPVFAQYADKSYNQDMLAVIKAFGDKGKMMIGHCAAAMMFESAGITAGKTLAVHPLAKPAIQNGKTTDEKFAVDGHFYTAETENAIWMMMDKVIKALSE
ncbi:DJ-1/PfpI family protein [Bacteroides sp. 51]|uniref:DJ-1/PfpI family protein n=1 Tax=Bacteroides sp. 51 TaxID=2302938 RepID=UPI0013D6CADF|nr:DJ-1/PfpI family protein [Bacteroides sp. 51]NDV84042.1 protease [Bacteroides sp. 51]